MSLASHIVSTFLQLVVFTAIPWAFYVITHKTTKGFFNYIGLTATTSKAIKLAAVTSLVFVAGGVFGVLLNDEIKYLLTNPPSVTGVLRNQGLGLNSIILLVTIACFRTALAEEIFFRGFIAKRLISALGYQRGNVLQSLIFGIVHVILLWTLANAGLLVMVFAFALSGIGGYLIGYIKEKYGNGSIIPGWIAHGLGNTLAYAIIAFIL